MEQGPNVSGLLEPDWVECRPLGASGSMTPWWPPSRGMGIGSRGFVMCLDLLTSVLMKMPEGVWGGGRGTSRSTSRSFLVLQLRLEDRAPGRITHLRSWGHAAQAMTAMMRCTQCWSPQITPNHMRSLLIADRLPTLMELNIPFAHVWQGHGH